MEIRREIVYVVVAGQMLFDFSTGTFTANTNLNCQTSDPHKALKYAKMWEATPKTCDKITRLEPRG